MAVYKLCIAYDGTAYGGWQVQTNSVSIQSILQEKMEICLRRPCQVTGAGRTDAGVHAWGQTAHFQLDEPLDIYRFKHSLNALLPSDIKIRECLPVPDSFHARYSAKAKIYHYRISRKANPFSRLYSWHIQGDLFFDKIEEGIGMLIGEHDFAGFANSNEKGIAAYDSVRTLKRVDVFHEGTEVRFEFEADGFLYRMVRNLMGTLIDVGKGKPNLIPLIFETKNRKLAGSSAPAHGLTLHQVVY